MGTHAHFFSAKPEGRLFWRFAFHESLQGCHPVLPDFVSTYDDANPASRTICSG